MTDKKLKKILYAAGGALMIIAGIFALCFPAGMLRTLALILGIVAVLSGACYILSFWFLKRTVGAGFLLADGIATGVLGLVLLINRFVRLIDMNVLFAILLMLLGMSLVVFSVQAKNYSVKRWWILSVAGGVSMLLGLLFLIIPNVVSIATSVIVGVALLVGGVSMLLGQYMAERNKDKIVTIREKDIEFIPDEPEEKKENDDNENKDE